MIRKGEKTREKGGGVINTICKGKGGAWEPVKKKGVVLGL